MMQTNPYVLLQTVATSTTYTVDASKYSTFIFTLQADVTSLTVNNPVAGATYTFVFVQDATGGHALAWPSPVKWTDAAPTLTAANGRLTVQMLWDGTTWNEVAHSGYNVGSLTVGSLTVTGNETVGGTLGVTGTTTSGPGTFTQTAAGGNAIIAGTARANDAPIKLQPNGDNGGTGSAIYIQSYGRTGGTSDFIFGIENWSGNWIWKTDFPATAATLTSAGALTLSAGLSATTGSFSSTLGASGAATFTAGLHSSGADFELRDAGVVDSTAVRVTSNSGVLYLQMGSGGMLFRNATASNVGSFDQSGNFVATNSVSAPTIYGTSASYALEARAGNGGGVFTHTQLAMAYNGGSLYRHEVKTRHDSATSANNAIDFFVWSTAVASTADPSLRVLSLKGDGTVEVPGPVAVSGGIYNSSYEALLLGNGTGVGRVRITDDGTYSYYQTDRSLAWTAYGTSVQRMLLDTNSNLTVAGATTSYGNITSGTSSSGTIVMVTGDGTHSGHLDFYNSALSANRQGYIGYAATSAAGDAGTLNYVAGTHAFSGAVTVTGNVTAAKYFGPSGGAGVLASRTSQNAMTLDWASSRVDIWVDSTRECSFAPSTSKTFVIDHPTKKDRFLVHAAVEGPENAVFYRGRVTVGPNEVVTVTLPDYFTDLCDESTATVTLTPIRDRLHDCSDPRDLCDWQIDRNMAKGRCNGLTNHALGVASSVKNGRFQVGRSMGFVDGDFEYAWLVIATRKDVPPLVVEPKRSDYVLRGDGPYTYLMPQGT